VSPISAPSGTELPTGKNLEGQKAIEGKDSVKEIARQTLFKDAIEGLRRKYAQNAGHESSEPSTGLITE